MSKTRDVTVAAGSVTTRDGKTHKQGVTVTLDDVEARMLKGAGLVRDAAPAKSEKKEG